MDEKRAFKQRVAEEAIRCAQDYKTVYVDNEYLICSDAFQKSPYYVVQAHEDNYRHLIGVSTTDDAAVFFRKCIDGTLQPEDFNFSKRGQSETAVKGSVRRKINALPLIMNMLRCGTMVEEDFSKNRINCSMATGKTECTLGFTASTPTKPMTLLKGNQLDGKKAKPISLVLGKSKGEAHFSRIVSGSVAELKNHLPDLEGCISQGLLDVCRKE